MIAGILLHTLVEYKFKMKLNFEQNNIAHECFALDPQVHE